MKAFWRSFYGRAVLVMAILDAIATVVLIGLGRVGWLLGVWGSAVWVGINAFLIWRITIPASSGKFPGRNTVLMWCVVKFPVLYLAGIGFLLLPGVHLGGVLVTLTAFVAGLAGALYLGSNFMEKRS